MRPHIFDMAGLGMGEGCTDGETGMDPCQDEAGRNLSCHEETAIHGFLVQVQVPDRTGAGLQCK